MSVERRASAEVNFLERIALDDNGGNGSSLLWRLHRALINSDRPFINNNLWRPAIRGLLEPHSVSVRIYIHEEKACTNATTR